MTGLASMVTSEYSSIPSLIPGGSTVEAFRKNSLKVKEQEVANVVHVDVTTSNIPS